MEERVREYGELVEERSRGKPIEIKLAGLRVAWKNINRFNLEHLGLRSMERH